jgi:nicotinate-nucleotide--dimethylbenzimidazole phosphoribosyltransferase
VPLFSKQQLFLILSFYILSFVCVCVHIWNRQTLARLTAPLLIKTRDYVDEQGPKYKFYSFFVEAKHLVTWYRAFFAIFTSFCVAALAYGILSAIGLIISVIVAVFFSGRYAEYLLGGVMGDYLGATICVTEVYLLTILVLLPNLEDHSLLLVDIVAMYTDFMRGVLSLDEILDDILNDDRKIALLKFIVVGIFTTIWCSSVGHPPVFVRTSVAAKGETNEVQISLNNNDDGDDEGQVVSALEAVLSDPERDFSSRYDTTRLYLDTLAKPVGSLGTLEDWGARLAVIQASSRPNVDKAVCLIFAADHGVAKDKSEGGANCSAYPQIVTQKVLEALEHNMAGASILAAQNQVNLRVIDVGLVMDTALTIGSSKVITSSEHRVEGGTKNFCKTSALSEEEVNACIIAGREEVQKHIKGSASNVLILGEVGIGNTTTSSALIAALTGVHVSALCDSGATTTRDAEDKSAIAKKVAIVEEAIKFHGASTMLHNPVASLRNVGGAEIATMVGAILEASEMNIAVLIDGFIVTTAAMIACHMSPDASRVLFLATRSTEKGQAVAIDVIQKIAKKNNIPKLSEPALNMGLRMGEGTGALTAMPILRSAAVILSDLATLDAVMNLGKSDSANC